MYQKYYQEFLKAHGQVKHFAAHSHHFWPDVAKEGHMLAYEQAVKLSDKKWDYAFATLIPEVQDIIAEQLNFSRPKDIAFAPNTHDLIVKLLSPSFSKKQTKILTTSEEFHSISRQLKRMDEEESFHIERVDPTQRDFKLSLEEKLKNNSYDFILMSHVFFTTGKILRDEIIQLIITHKKDAVFVLDGYHHYAAIPFDLSPYENELYYLSGGYKYAQGGEGVCFMTMPQNCQIRPLITGWFASFKDLSSPQSVVGYENSGLRFWGSTIDLTPFYRFRAVWQFFKQESISIASIHSYVKGLQKKLIKDCTFFQSHFLEDLSEVGHFLTVDMECKENAETLYKFLDKKNIVTDFRGKYLRFGLAPYQTEQDITYLKDALNLFKSQ